MNSGQDFLTLLNKLDIKTASCAEAFDWLFLDEKTADLTNWLCKHITEENVLTNDELAEVEHMKDIGLWMDGEILDTEVENLRKDYPYFFEPSDLSLLELENDVSFLSKREASLNEMISGCLSIEANFKEQKSKTSFKLSTMKLEYDKNIKECKEISYDLDKLCAAILEKFNTLKKSYEMPKQMNCYQISQDFISSFNNQVEKLINRVEFALEYNIKDDAIKTISDSIATRSICDLICSTKFLNVLSQIESQVLLKFASFLDSYKIRSFSDETIMIKNGLLNIQSQRKKLELQKQNLKMAVSKNCDQSYELQFLPMLKNQLIKKRKYNEKLKLLAQKCNIFHEYSGVIHSILCVQNADLKSMNTFLKQNLFYISLVQDNSKTRIPLLEKFHSAGTSTNEPGNELSNPNIKYLLRAFENIDSINQFLKYLADTNKKSKMLEYKYFEEISHQNSQLFATRMKVTDAEGPFENPLTKQPVLKLNDILEHLVNTASSVNDVERKIDVVHSLLSEAKHKLKADPYLKNQRLLWFYFYKKSEKLDKIMESLERINTK